MKHFLTMLFSFILFVCGFSTVPIKQMSEIEAASIVIISVENDANYTNEALDYQIIEVVKNLQAKDAVVMLTKIINKDQKAIFNYQISQEVDFVYIGYVNNFDVDNKLIATIANHIIIFGSINKLITQSCHQGLYMK